MPADYLAERSRDFLKLFTCGFDDHKKSQNVGVLFWSLDAASNWTGREWCAILARETEEARTRLGLVLLRDTAIPELLRTKQRIDARRDHNEALQETVEWLIRLRDMRRFEEMKAETVLINWLAKYGFASGYRFGERDAALRISEEEERYWVSREGRTAKCGLQACYGNQALILKAWGKLEDALKLHR